MKKVYRRRTFQIFLISFFALPSPLERWLRRGGERVRFSFSPWWRVAGRHFFLDLVDVDDDQ